MATIAIKTIRQRIETAIAAVSGWHRSRSPGDIFGLDPNTYAHQAFSIDIPSTTDLGTSRQNTAALSIGARVSSELRLQWSYRIRPKSQVDSLDSALDAEAELVEAVMGVARTDLQLRYQTAARIIEPRGEWLIGDIRFFASHLLTLG